MSGILNKLGLAGLALFGAIATAGSAFAQAQAPAINSGGWVAIAIIGGLVVLILFVIGGSLSLSKRRSSRDDADMVGVLEGEDDEGKRD